MKRSFPHFLYLFFQCSNQTPRRCKVNVDEIESESLPTVRYCTVPKSSNPSEATAILIHPKIRFRLRPV